MDEMNTGNYNDGDCNTGNHNTGNCNTGGFNTGDCNTGYCNTGGFNTGDDNTGSYNTGSYNTGSFNTGGFNTGNYNTGDCNTGDRNTGFLCTGKQTVEIFNKPSNLTYHELYSSAAYEVVRSIFDHDEDGRQGYWDSLRKDDQKQVKRLPNFDAQIFKQITGVSVGEDKCTSIFRTL